MDMKSREIQAMIGCIAAAVIVIGAAFLLFEMMGLSDDKLYYADGFTVEKFKKVKPGMTKQEVRGLLGERIQLQRSNISDSDVSEFWYYSSIGWSDPAPAKQHGVGFDKQERVIRITWPQKRN